MILNILLALILPLRTNLEAPSTLSMPYMDEPPSGANEEKGDAFQSLVKTLRDMLGPSSGIDSADIDPEHVQKLMRAYVSDEREWSRYALCDSSRGYTRNLVDEGNGRSNLVSLITL